MKKFALTVIKIAVSVGLYVYIFSKIDLAHLWEILKEASPWYFVAAIGVYFLIQGLSAYRWYLLLKPLEIRVPYTKLLSFTLMGMFFNNFMPTGIGGDVFRIYYLRKQTRRLSPATASVFFDRDLGMAALLLIATLAATFTGMTFKGVLLAPIFGLILLAFAAVNFALFYRPTYNLLHRLLMLFKMKEADKRVEHLFESVNSYRGQWGLIATTIAISMIVQIGCSAVNILAADAIGMKTQGGWINYLVFIPAIGLITMIPVSVNGMGWREFSYLVLFVSVGASEAQATALAFLWLGVLVITSLPGGIIYALTGSRQKEPLPIDEDVIEPDALAVQSVRSSNERRAAVSASTSTGEETVST